MNEELQEKQREAEKQADAYIASLYALLPHLNLSGKDQQGKAHGILNMIAAVQRIHDTLDNPNATHEERKEAFNF